MTETFTILSERVDHMPILLADRDRMGVQPCWTSIFPPMASGWASASAG